MGTVFERNSRAALLPEMVESFFAEINTVDECVLLRYLTLFAAIEAFEDCQRVHLELNRRGVVYEWHPVPVR